MLVYDPDRPDSRLQQISSAVHDNRAYCYAEHVVSSGGRKHLQYSFCLPWQNGQAAMVYLSEGCHSSHYKPGSTDSNFPEEQMGRQTDQANQYELRAIEISSKNIDYWCSYFKLPHPPTTYISLCRGSPTFVRNLVRAWALSTLSRITQHVNSRFGWNYLASLTRDKKELVNSFDVIWIPFRLVASLTA